MVIGDNHETRIGQGIVSLMMGIFGYETHSWRQERRSYKGRTEFMDFPRGSDAVTFVTNVFARVRTYQELTPEHVHRSRLLGR